MWDQWKNYRTDPFGREERRWVDRWGEFPTKDDNLEVIEELTKTASISFRADVVLSDVTFPTITLLVLSLSVMLARATDNEFNRLTAPPFGFAGSLVCMPVIMRRITEVTMRVKSQKPNVVRCGAEPKQATHESE